MDSNHTGLAVISLDSALKKDENYDPQIFQKIERWKLWSANISKNRV